MRLHKLLIAAAILGTLAFSATAFAADDAYRAGRDAAEVEKKGEEIGRAAARDGKRIAEEATEAAKKIANDFTEGYEDAK